VSKKVVSIDAKQKDASDYKMSHSEDIVEAFFHNMYTDGKLDDVQMARIAERMPGFRLPKARQENNS
jgi:hypothetical protein